MWRRPGLQCKEAQGTACALAASRLVSSPASQLRARPAAPPAHPAAAAAAAAAACAAQHRRAQLDSVQACPFFLRPLPPSRGLHPRASGRWSTTLQIALAPPALHATCHGRAVARTFPFRSLVPLSFSLPLTLRPLSNHTILLTPHGFQLPSPPLLQARAMQQPHS